MEITRTCSSETLVNTYLTTRCHNQGVHSINTEVPMVHVLLSDDEICVHSECCWVVVRGPTEVLRSKGGVTSRSQTPPPFEEEAPFQNTKSWKEQKYGHGSRWGSKPRRTVLARANSNLPDWSLQCWIQMRVHFLNYLIGSSSENQWTMKTTRLSPRMWCCVVW
jgi:hypothetical protein